MEHKEARAPGRLLDDEHTISYLKMRLAKNTGLEGLRLGRGLA